MKWLLPRYRTRLLHVTAVWAYGVTQPVLALVDGNPDLLLARDASRVDLALFATVVAVGYPVLAVAYCWFVGRLSRWAGDVLYLVALGAALAPLAARAVKPVDPQLAVGLALVGVLSAAGVLAYARWRPVQLFTGYSMILPIVASALFLHGVPTLTDDAEAAPASVEVESPVPVVMIVLDELPAASLMTASGKIDAARYPAFGRLARESTWYRNATTVHEWTSDALPAMLGGRVVRKGALPTARNHPQTLFSLLGPSYALAVHESKTQLCPDRHCPREDQPAGEVVHALAQDTSRLLIPRILPQSFASRLIQVNEDIDLEEHAAHSIDRCDSSLSVAVEAAADNTFFYCHLLLPHAPWRFLPSGVQYDGTGLDGWFPTERWGNQAWPVLQGYQRHLLQVGYTDRLLGRMLRRLQRAGLYDRALVVVAADHGVSFRPGESRRVVTGRNFADIANVPLFVKYPGQTLGRLDDRNARTVDIVPTIADVLDARLPWDADGVSLLAQPLPKREVVVDQRGGHLARGPLARLVADRSRLLREKAASFGRGRDSLYAIGSNRRLLGLETAGVPRDETTVRARIENAGELASVEPQSGYLPTRIFGRVTSGRIDPSVELAVAVNGRVQALTHVFRDHGDQVFRALVPEAALRHGDNAVEVFVIRGTGARPLLAPIASTG